MAKEIVNIEKIFSGNIEKNDWSELIEVSEQKIMKFDDKWS